MGIRGLHGLLKSIQKPCNLKQFKGQTLGVDAYGWLHRGAIACSVDLVLDRPTTKHIDFVLNRVRMLIYFGVKPYLVFDGDNLPSKAGTEIDRHRRRQESKALGLELQRKGRTAEAYQELQKAVDVTPYMARQLIEELKKMGVQYVVAPYEADPQLVYLEREGIIDGIISEDSDLLVFGAKRLLSKLNQHGDCIEINRADFAACREVSFVGWTDADFRRMCILSGCDYLPRIAGLGLKTAYRGFRKYKNVEKALRMLQFEGQYHVPADYLENFRQAELTFLYQRVFCPKAGKLVTLTPPERGIELEGLIFIGEDVDPEIAVGVASGELDPTTKEPINLKPIPQRRGNPGVIRRQTLGSSADLKPNKPISSFFTPKRMPLAELDPNSLSPLPSQQYLLERHANNSWEASFAPSRPSLMRSATSLASSTSPSSPLVRSAERNSFLARAAKISTFQPAKRQRLCSETEDETLPARPDCRSRFFADNPQDSSPSGQKVMRSKKPRKSSLDVFSDDQVIEDIMSQLPDPAEQGAECEPDAESSIITAGSHKATSDSSSPSHLIDSPATSQDDQGEQKEGVELAEGSQPTCDSSVSFDSDPKIFRQVLDYHIEKQNTQMLSKYAFQSGASPASSGKGDVGAMKPTVPTTRGVKPGNSSARLLWGDRENSPKRKRLAPLQRLGQSALSRSRSLNISTIRTMGTNSNKLSPRKNVPVNRRMVSTNGISHRGSEDLLVPNSDEEESDSHPTEKPEPVILDLKRFSFTAR